MDLDATLSSRDDINKRLRTILDEATDKWGVRIDRVEVKNIDPPQDIKDAMEKQMRAERNRRSSILEAEAEKEAQIKRAEGQAKAILQIATAQAEQIQRIFKALKEADVDEKMLSVKYIEALEKMAEGDNKVFVPFEATGLMGSIATVKELLNKSK